MADVRTFGLASIGGSFVTLQPDMKYGCMFNMPDAGVLSKLTAYLAGGATAQPLVAEVYADSGRSPGSRKALTSPITLAASQGAGWVDFAFPSPVTLIAGDYWLSILAGPASSPGVVYVSQGARLETWSNPNVYSSGPSDPWGSGSFVDAWKMSIYGTYTPADTDPPSCEITAPFDKSFQTADFDVTVSAGDDVAVASVTFYMDGQIVLVDTTPPYVYHVVAAAAGDGAHQFVAVAADAAGNKTSSRPVNLTISTLIDSAPPVATVAEIGMI